MWRRILLVVVVLLAGIWLFNASFLAPEPQGTLKFIAHRGQHQNFDTTGITSDTCTATRIRPPIVSEIENTLPAMQAAFSAGASVVELDVHPTTDGKFAVFHDWTLECRTNGTGETRSHDMAYLKTLDVGFGYTADGGKTWPLRGSGVGMMPELSEVLAAFPQGRFLVNFKSKEAREGDMLAAFLAANPQYRDQIWGVYGGDPPTLAAKAALPEIHAFARKSLLDCLIAYEAYGWTGLVPSACRSTTLMLPINFTPFVWGWPNRFIARMESVGTTIILIGPYAPGDAGTSGIDSPETVKSLPSFNGYIWTNEIAAMSSDIHHN